MHQKTSEERFYAQARELGWRWEDSAELATVCTDRNGYGSATHSATTPNVLTLARNAKHGQARAYGDTCRSKETAAPLPEREGT